MVTHLFYFCFLLGYFTHSTEISSESITEPCANKLERRHEDGKCYRINRRGPCPSHMKFYSFGNISGLCDCPVDNNFLFWNETNECFRRNTQGPCNKEEWITFVNDTQCLPLPDGCQNNGQYVYWSSSDDEPKKCYLLGERGPCDFNEKLIMKEGLVLCSDGKYSAVDTPFLACPPGSRRYSLGCQKVYFGKSTENSF